MHESCATQIVRCRELGFEGGPPCERGFFPYRGSFPQPPAPDLEQENMGRCFSARAFLLVAGCFHTIPDSSRQGS